MSSADDALEYRKLRAPREHGATLVDPPWPSVPGVFESNRAALARHATFDLQGRTLHALAIEARQTLLALARVSEDSNGEPDAFSGVSSPDLVGPDTESPSDLPPLILTGHQPQMFHPGVWFKNFALATVANRCAARPVNLVIDNDTIRQAAIKAPAGSAERPRLESVPFDVAADEVPFEERRVLDADVWETFAERVRRTIGPLVGDPLVTELWPTAVDARRRGSALGWCLSVARRRLERTWGLDGADVPLSAVCDSPPFRWFAAHLLAHAPRLRRVYNESLEDYRRIHRVRSRSHPVPALLDDGGWVECPFWIWSDEAPRRSRLFARRSGARVELTDRVRHSRMIDLPEDGDAARAVEQLGDWRAAGVKIRPRALVTTLFARLLLSDLFLHGIGGAKYDQLTDAIARRFLGIALPRFLTLTATLCLPIPHRRVTADDVRNARQRIREMRFHPERFIEEAIRAGGAADGDWRTLLARKHELLERQLPRGERLERHRELSQLNAALQPWIDPLRAASNVTCARLAADAARHALLASREYSYGLFPAQVLRAHLLELSAFPR